MYINSRMHKLKWFGMMSICFGIIQCVEDKDFWYKVARQELEAALNMRINQAVAKNVILFLGDGMGIPTITAARIYKGQMNGQPGEETKLNFEKFPHVALSKTYNVDAQTPDSAGTATAYLCGAKTNLATIGVDARVLLANCSQMGNQDVKLTSILDWSLQEKKSVGIVTTARVTHASPAAAYAHVPHRDWESDVNMNRVDLTCLEGKTKVKDIAAQLIDDNPDIQVILGGGSKSFQNRKDGRNLIREWSSNMDKLKRRANYVNTKNAFDRVSPNQTDYLLGLFDISHMSFELDRDPALQPSLSEMTAKAIQILSKNPKGFFLLVEGGKIDHGHHSNQAKYAVDDTVAMDQAVGVAQSLTNQDDTLIVVTADHSHVMSLVGYPSRGNNILGFAGVADDGLLYTSLVYANGPGPGRTNLNRVDTTVKNFRQQRLVPMRSETHGGEDVGIFATGPYAHLFHGVHEQNYIPHVMAYASCVGSIRNPACSRS